MGEEQSTVNADGPAEGRPPGGGEDVVEEQTEPRRPQGEGSGAAGPRAPSPDPGGGGGGWDRASPELGKRVRKARGQPAAARSTEPLDPRTLQQQEEEQERREWDEPSEPELGERASPPDGLVLEVLGRRRHPAAKRHIYCTVYCVENDLPEAPTREQPSSPNALASPVPPAVPSSTSSSTSSATSPPSPDLSPPSDPLAFDGSGRGSSVELDLYLAPEPFSVSSLIGAPPYPGLGGLGDPYSALLVLSCRVCLEDKAIKPLTCCKKAVCEECLKRYLSAQMRKLRPREVEIC